MRTFHDLIASHEDWLVTRTLQYAKRHGYTRHSSTLLEAWRLSVAGLSAALIAAIKDPSYDPELAADADYTTDPMTAFGVEHARRHRARGTDLTMFLALLKYYRQSYLDLIAENITDQSNFRACYDFALKMFDKIELGCNHEWQKVSFQKELDTLQMRNKELTEEKLSYLTIFETLKDPVIFADNAGRIKNMNRSACVCFTQYATPGAIYYGKTDLSEAELLFKPFLNFSAPEAEFSDCLLLTRTGIRRFHVKARRMIDSSERMAGVVLICVDITDYQQALQDAAQADKAKSAFLATMSHELRTPAAGILGAAELLGQTGLLPGQLHYLDLIETSAATLLGLLDEVLDYSKFEEVGVTTQSEDFDLGAVIENIVKIMRDQAQRKSVGLNVTIAAEMPPRLHGDANKLTRVLMNLIGNAVKFTNQGAIDLTVTTAGIGYGGGLILKFSVADTGIGFAPEKIEQLFKPFTQGDDTISRKFGGTGLGLAICKRIVDALGGEIGAESRGEKGSIFWFSLPFHTAQMVPPPISIPAAEPPKPLSILMVEDNDVNQIVGLGLLEQMGHHPDLASDGEDALSMLADKDYDVVLLDLHLPGLSGCDVARAIRALGNPRKAQVPIIALTADDSMRARQLAATAGIGGFLLKPLRSQDLRTAFAGIHSEGHTLWVKSLSAPLMDHSVLEEHARELGSEIAAKIATAFCCSTEDFKKEIAEALNDKQANRLTHAFHKIKGGALNLGLTRLTEFAADLEKNTPSMPPEDLKQDITRFLACLAESVAGLETVARGYLAKKD